MAPFTSARERRLWLWTLVVVVAIYATLGLARTLAGELRNRDLLDAVFVACFLAVIATSAILGLRLRARGRELGVLVGVVAVYVMVLVRIALPEERTHLIEYGVVGLLILEALLERRSNGRPVVVPGVLAVLAATSVGVVDELIQGVLPGRSFDYRDIGFNAVAAALAVAARLALGRAGERARNRRRPSLP